MLSTCETGRKQLSVIKIKLNMLNNFLKAFKFIGGIYHRFPMVVEKRRGRKPKNTSEQTQEECQNETLCEAQEAPETKVQKKRGRKPKGGKIVECPTNDDKEGQLLPNIIAHFKCNISDIESLMNEEAYKYPSTWHTKNMEDFQSSESNNIEYAFLSGADLLDESVTKYDENQNNNSNNSNNNNTNNQPVKHFENDNDMTDVYRKLKELEVQFHNNDLNGKRSACFWDTCPFDTPAFYIPKLMDSDSLVKPYGCFCCLECALAYLESEELDSSCKFERRQLLFHMYRGIINNRLSVKPAPEPRYTLDKFFGNLTIQEWRKLLKSDRMLLVVDKPLTPELPELHVESADRLIAPGTMSGSEIAQYGKFKIRKNAPPPSKGAIVAQRFGKS